MGIFSEIRLVLDAIKDLEPERRCWRLVGGALIERSVGEVLPALQSNIEMIDKTSVIYGESLKNKEKEMIEFELKFYE